MSTANQLPITTDRTRSILGTPLLLASYDSLGDACQRWAALERATAIEFANTQIVTMRRQDPAFRSLTHAYDYFIPDGMPLVWCLNRQGAGLRDRVYGPTFMRKFLSKAPGRLTHFLLGGSTECGHRLKEVFGRINPAIRFVGSYHGVCDAKGSLEKNDDAAVIDEINRLSPDFIWVGFGTPKQQAWLRRNKHRLRRGVVLTVGFAFDVNAGMKPDAPKWMQRWGLTWLFRMASEPRRLVVRYLRYNSLFLFYLALDGLRGKAFSPAQQRPLVP